MAKKNALGALALARLFDLAIEHGRPIAEAEVLAGVRKLLDERLDNVIANDARDGWSNTAVGDLKNDYPGDALDKRIDNCIFLFGKALPGRITDSIRDAVSPTVTPKVRAQLGADPTGAVIAAAVAEALYDEAAALVASVP